LENDMNPNPGRGLCQILTPTHAMSELVACRDASLVGTALEQGSGYAKY
jgi:hypothetical protein